MLTYDSLLVNSFVECGKSAISCHSFFQTGFTRLSGFFSCFFLDKDRIGNWLRVACYPLYFSRDVSFSSPRGF